MWRRAEVLAAQTPEDVRNLGPMEISDVLHVLAGSVLLSENTFFMRDDTLRLLMETKFPEALPFPDFDVSQACLVSTWALWHERSYAMIFITKALELSPTIPKTFWIRKEIFDHVRKCLKRINRSYKTGKRAVDIKDRRHMTGCLIYLMAIFGTFSSIIELMKNRPSKDSVSQGLGILAVCWSYLNESYRKFLLGCLNGIHFGSAFEGPEEQRTISELVSHADAEEAKWIVEERGRMLTGLWKEKKYDTVCNLLDILLESKDDLPRYAQVLLDFWNLVLDSKEEKNLILPRLTGFVPLLKQMECLPVRLFERLGENLKCIIPVFEHIEGELDESGFSKILTSLKGSTETHTIIIKALCRLPAHEKSLVRLTELIHVNDSSVDSALVKNLASTQEGKNLLIQGITRMNEEETDLNIEQLAYLLSHCNVARFAFNGFADYMMKSNSLQIASFIEMYPFVYVNDLEMLMEFVPLEDFAFKFVREKFSDRLGEIAGILLTIGSESDEFYELLKTAFNETNDRRFLWKALKIRPTSELFDLLTNEDRQYLSKELIELFDVNEKLKSGLIDQIEARKALCISCKYDILPIVRRLVHLPFKLTIDREICSHLVRCKIETCKFVIEAFDADEDSVFLPLLSSSRLPLVAEKFKAANVINGLQEFLAKAESDENISVVSEVLRNISEEPDPVSVGTVLPSLFDPRFPSFLLDCQAINALFSWFSKNVGAFIDLVNRDIIENSFRCCSVAPVAASVLLNIASSFDSIVLTEKGELGSAMRRLRCSLAPSVQVPDGFNPKNFQLLLGELSAESARLFDVIVATRGVVSVLNAVPLEVGASLQASLDEYFGQNRLIRAPECLALDLSRNNKGSFEIPAKLRVIHNTYHVVSALSPSCSYVKAYCDDFWIKSNGSACQYLEALGSDITSLTMVFYEKRKRIREISPFYKEYSYPASLIHAISKPGVDWSILPMGGELELCLKSVLLSHRLPGLMKNVIRIPAFWDHLMSSGELRHFVPWYKDLIHDGAILHHTGPERIIDGLKSSPELVISIINDSGLETPKSALIPKMLSEQAFRSSPEFIKFVASCGSDVDCGKYVWDIKLFCGMKEIVPVINCLKKCQIDWIEPMLGSVEDEIAAAGYELMRRTWNPEGGERLWTVGDRIEKVFLRTANSGNEKRMVLLIRIVNAYRKWFKDPIPIRDTLVRFILFQGVPPHGLEVLDCFPPAPQRLFFMLYDDREECNHFGCLCAVAYSEVSWQEIPERVLGMMDDCYKTCGDKQAFEDMCNKLLAKLSQSPPVTVSAGMHLFFGYGLVIGPCIRNLVSRIASLGDLWPNFFQALLATTCPLMVKWDCRNAVNGWYSDEEKGKRLSDILASLRYLLDLAVPRFDKGMECLFARRLMRDDSLIELLRLSPGDTLEFIDAMCRKLRNMRQWLSIYLQRKVKTIMDILNDENGKRLSQLVVRYAVERIIGEDWIQLAVDILGFARSFTAAEPCIDWVIDVMGTENRDEITICAEKVSGLITHLFAWKLSEPNELRKTRICIIDLFESKRFEHIEDVVNALDVHQKEEIHTWKILVNQSVSSALCLDRSNYMFRVFALTIRHIEELLKQDSSNAELKEIYRTMIVELSRAKCY